MTQVLLFHHAQGQTAGFLEFAEELRQAGHQVHAPDLYAGQIFDSLEEGVTFAEEVGLGEITELGVESAADLPEKLVYAGFSLGALPAQALAQLRPGARGALLFHGGVPAATFDAPWPAGVPLQLHLMDGDEWSEVDVAQGLVDPIDDGELFLYPGDGHLFADRYLPDYDEQAAKLLWERTLEFLDRVG